MIFLGLAILCFSLVISVPLFWKKWHAPHNSTKTEPETGENIPTTTAATTAPSTTDTSPRIIVNVPSDLKVFAPLPNDTCIDGQKALLWYHVYNNAVDAFTDSGESYLTLSENTAAINAANQAVHACYGNPQ